MPQGSHFDYWWERQGKWVEPPNQRRGGESGVQILQQDDSAQPLLYCKRQVEHLYRSIFHPWGRPTILREQLAYQSFERFGIKVPRIVYCGARKHGRQWQALLVTEALETGFVSLDRWYDSIPIEKHDSSTSHAVFRELGATLARLHLSGWQHGCCYPKHLFVRVLTLENENTRIEVALLDLEKSRRRWRMREAARHDLNKLWRHRGTIREADWNFLLDAHDRFLVSTTTDRGNTTLQSIHETR